jgi:hypothetical protein
MLIQKSHETRLLSPFYKQDRVMKLKHFEEAKSLVPKSDLEYLKLWESVLTGRSAPVSKILKEKYKELGLNHVFTPSGFHLSAVLSPFMKLIKVPRNELIILFIIGMTLCLLPGFGALKRMVLIKGQQKIFGRHEGFILALILDILWGSFQESTLSFTYSFLFLGIIYSGYDGLILVLYFFFAQIMIAFFQGSDISPLLLIFSPLLNLLFTVLMPFLFLLAIPLWSWQLKTGILLLKVTQEAVDLCANMSMKFPTIEINLIGLMMIVFLQRKQWKTLAALSLLYCHDLNLDHLKAPAVSRNDFYPQGKIVLTQFKDDTINVVFSDGRCRMKLVRGFWWENCSPKRRSSRKKN